MTRYVLGVAVTAALVAASCAPLFTWHAEVPPRNLPSWTITLVNETGKPLTEIRCSWSARGRSGTLSEVRSASSEVGRYPLMRERSIDGPVTIEDLAVALDGREVLVAKGQRLDEPGDVEVVLKSDLMVVYRVAKKEERRAEGALPPPPAR
jgi:hypothetical protein